MGLIKMANNSVCAKCGRGCEIPCEAVSVLLKLYTDLKHEEKATTLKALRQELDLVDYEVAEDLRELANKVISAIPELSIIRDFNIRVGYVRGYESKQGKGKQVYADCKKITGTYTAYLPFDFVVTFYEPNIGHLSENQRKILMLHELRHIGIGERGFKIIPHDVEDFRDILQRFGIEWNEFGQDVPDILAGGDVEKTNGKKK